MATKLTGAGTSWDQVTAGDPAQIVDNDLAWEFMFVHGRAAPASRQIRLPGFPPVDPAWVADVLLDKREADGDPARMKPPAPGAANGDRCVLCHLPFGAEYEDPTFGWITIERNRRNRYYCNVCDAFIRICPGKATLTLPVLVVDVKESRRIRRDLGDLSAYSRMLGHFQREVQSLLQEHMGLVLNTIGDAVVAVWPSGFVTDGMRERYGWDPERPARIPALLATKAAEDIADIAPVDFDGRRLPFRAALDTSPMIVFAVTTTRPDLAGAFEAGPGDALVGDAVLSADPSDFGAGPAATDIAGEAVEVASELASAVQVPGGSVCITRRTDEVAGTSLDHGGYDHVGSNALPVRVIHRAGEGDSAPQPR